MKSIRTETKIIDNLGQTFRELRSPETMLDSFNSTRQEWNTVISDESFVEDEDGNYFKVRTEIDVTVECVNNRRQVSKPIPH